MVYTQIIGRGEGKWNKNTPWNTRKKERKMLTICEENTPKYSKENEEAKLKR